MMDDFSGLFVTFQFLHAAVQRLEQKIDRQMSNEVLAFKLTDPGLNGEDDPEPADTTNPIYAVALMLELTYR